MTASRGDYEVTLITAKDSAWVQDEQQKNCYVCTKVKLKRGNRHHCRLCGNMACKDCIPRICKKCLAEKLNGNVYSEEKQIMSASSKRKSASTLQLELDSFKKGYQEMRKIYEEYVSTNESKIKEYIKREKEHEQLIEILHKKVDDTNQSKAKYKQAVDINANQVRELQQNIQKLKAEYQTKLNAQIEQNTMTRQIEELINDKNKLLNQFSEIQKQNDLLIKENDKYKQ
eukprot:428003_1